MKKTIILNGKVYKSTSTFAQTCLDVAKDRFRSEDKNAIYAVERNDIVEMKKETFNSLPALNKAILNYTKQGFKVYSVRRA